MFNVGLLVLVQMNLEQSGSIQTETNPLADDLSGVDKIIKDSTVHGNQSTAPWPLLLLLVHLTSGFGKNSTLGNEYHVFAGELLFQFTDQTSLDLLEGLQLWHGNEDDNGLFALTNFNFLGGGDVQFPQMTLEVGVHLQVEQSLGDGLLEVVGRLAIGLDNLGSSSC